MKVNLRKAIILLVCFLSLPVLGQEKAFKAGMKKGKNAEGYYHADLSKTAYTQDHLAYYAKNNGLILKNMKEEDVVQFGTLYRAVVSVDFLPVSEITSNMGDGASPLDSRMLELIHILNTSFNAQGGKDLVKYGQKIELGVDRYSKEDLKKAGLLCGYVLYEIITGGGGLFGPVPENFYFLSKEGLEDRLFRRMNGGKTIPFSSVGSALFYPSSERCFQEFQNLKWTGATVNGKLDGSGLGYNLDEGNSSVRCVVGRFVQGVPMGECQFYAFSVKDLVDGTPVPVSINVHPSQDGLVRCDVDLGNYSYVSFVNESYDNVIPDINRLSADLLGGKVEGSEPARVVKDFENGTATLAWNVGTIAVEYLIDRKGNGVGITKNAQSSIDAFLDEVASHYDKYLSKVLNPTEVIRPVTSLKAKCNYELTQFPAEEYKALTSPEFLHSAISSYNSRKSMKPDLAYNTYKLLTVTSELEENVKKERESTVIRKASNIGLTRGFLFTRPTKLSDFASFMLYDSYSYNASSCLDEIGKNPLRPSNFSTTKASVEKEFSRAITWWENVCNRAANILSDRHASAEKSLKEYKRRMCDNCLVDGKQSSFPKGFVEAYEGIFTSYPAQSETDGELVLKNGEKCSWKYIYHSSGTEIEVGGTYSGTFDSVDEMINTILEKCNERWGQK